MTAEASGSTPRFSSRAILLLGLATGVATGLLEALVLLARKVGLHQLIHVSAHYGWMAPLGDLVLFSLPAAGLALLAGFVPRLKAVRLVLFLFGWIALTCLLVMWPGFHRVAALALAAGLAWQLARLAAPRAELLERRIGSILVGLLLLMATLAGTTFGWQALRERQAEGRLVAVPAGRPNILLIILDTVRAKSLSLYGYDRSTSPALSRLAARGVRFERAFATASWTLPSHASLLTGRYPHELSADWQVPLDRREPTLAERLSAEGYATAGFVANVGYLSWEFGLDRGFQHYEDFLVRPSEILTATSLGRQLNQSLILRNLLQTDQHLVRIDAPSINRRFLSWVDSRQGRPFFAFLNYYDAHGPYLPPRPWDRMFGPPRESDVSPIHRFLSAPGKTPPDAATVQAEINQYDGAIAYLDDQLGCLFAQLASRHLLENTVVLLTSDHGEEFGEHGVFDHGNSLYRASVQVPLLVIYPPAVPPGRSVADPVTLRDVAATLTQLAGVGSGSLPGGSLARFWQSQEGLHGDAQSPVISEVSQGIRTPPWYPVSKGDMRSLAGPGQRYILNGDGSEELFDLNDDWERQPLPVIDSLVAPFRSELARWPWLR